MSRWMNVQEVAEYLSLKPSTIYAYVSERKVPHYKKGHVVRFKQEEIDEWMATGRVQTTDEYLAKHMQRKE